MTELTRKQRRGARLRQLMVELDRRPEGLSWADAWPLLSAAVPVVEEDLEKTTNRRSQGRERRAVAGDQPR